ncbi:AroM family protein [Fodinicurvata sp. EGI_FJ10296]|uniref:AroM family protein n=1 Tax=Fodinicurvata sp. EGI_FJ10296 TaxID=3231908 RepID=UPI003455C32A
MTFEKRIRVAIVTGGQTPRNDLVPDVLAHLPEPYDVHQFGALDGLDEQAIAGLAPEPGDPGFSTLLRSGRQVVISKSRIGERLAKLMAGLDEKHFDLVVLLSTGLVRNFESRSPTVNGQRALESAVNALVSAGQTVGVIQPIARQVPVTTLDGVEGVEFRLTSAAAGDADALARAAEDLSGCDIIVLNAVTFDEHDRAVVSKASGKPVVLARRVIAGAVRLLLAPELTGGAVARPLGGADILADRLQRLTPRERQVMSLIAEGLPNKSIGLQLSISPRTVEIHRAKVLSKMEVVSSTALIRLLLSSEHPEL